MSLAEGTETGDVAVTVAEAKLAATNVYKYKVGDAAVDVEYGDNVQNWTLWDGEDDITAAEGKIITLVEATSDYKAVAVGTAEVELEE